VSRVIHLKLDADAVEIRCRKEKVGVSAIERLPAGGVRLVCKSSDGAALIRRKLKANVMDGEPAREPRRPSTPLW